MLEAWSMWNNRFWVYMCKNKRRRDLALLNRHMWITCFFCINFKCHLLFGVCAIFVCYFLCTRTSKHITPFVFWVLMSLYILLGLYILSLEANKRISAYYCCCQHVKTCFFELHKSQYVLSFVKRLLPDLFQILILRILLRNKNRHFVESCRCKSRFGYFNPFKNNLFFV